MLYNWLQLSLLYYLFFNQIFDICTYSVICCCLNYPWLRLLVIVFPVVAPVQPHVSIQGWDVLEPSLTDGALDHAGWRLLVLVDLDGDGAGLCHSHSNSRLVRPEIKLYLI